MFKELLEKFRKPQKQEYEEEFLPFNEIENDNHKYRKVMKGNIVEYCLPVTENDNTLEEE